MPNPPQEKKGGGLSDPKKAPLGRNLLSPFGPFGDGAPNQLMKGPNKRSLKNKNWRLMK